MQSDQEVISLNLLEDRPYSLEELANLLRAQNDLTMAEAEIVTESIKKYVDTILRRKLEILRSLYANIDIKIEAELPRQFYDKGILKITFGQWVGIYEIKYSDTEILVHVLPKIGLENFRLMLNQISKLVEMIGIPMLDIIISNIRGTSFIKQLVSYSLRLRKLTELMIKEGIPPISYIKEYYIDSNTSYTGNISYGKTLKLLMFGQQTLVAKKRVIGYPELPISILVKFHRILGEELSDLINRVANNDLLRDFPDLYKFLMGLANYHYYILSISPFSQYAVNIPNTYLEDYKILEKAKDQAYMNRWLVDIIDLYTDFIRDIDITKYIYEKRQINIQPLPSSKVYELWVLYLLLDEGVKLFKRKISANENYLRYSFNDYTITYNTSGSHNLLKFYNYRIRDRPRPDYIISNSSKCAVADAKYREIRNIGSEDLKRMIYYIVNYSVPQSTQYENEIKGIFISLSSEYNYLNIYEGMRHLLERPDLTPSLKVYHVEVDPRNLNTSRVNIDYIYKLIYS